ncbi:MAG: Lrp/AsnC family transcriptional regulator [Candidatus Marinimicrobia bacterium]|nr:Lrp/AsnC family transcriptional regulator [Candidatus Neomarinimicrobiota bacterium]
MTIHENHYELDQTDRKILDILQVDGRASASYIAEQISMSVPSTSERIKKLKDGGIILGYQAVIDPHSVGLDVLALITIISDSSDHYIDVVDKANQTPEVVWCFSTTGRGSHLMMIETESSRSLEKLLRAIQQWPGVKRTETQIILSSYKRLAPVRIPE